MAVVIRMVPGQTEADGSYTKPKELLKTYVGTTKNSRAFGRDLRPTPGVGPTSGPDGPGTETERRGIKRAKEVVFLGDHGHPKAGRCAAGCPR